MSEVLIYETEGGQARVDVRLEAETVWLSQRQMAELFDKNVRTVSEHIRNIFNEGELVEESVIRNFRITVADGKSYDTAHYNLDVIISVGYRVKSQRGTKFRQWATRTLREHLVKGYALNQTRLAERGITEAQRAIELLARTLNNQALVSDTGSEVLSLIVGYAKTWRLLLQYDESGLVLPESCRPARGALDHGKALAAIAKLKAELMARGEATALLGRRAEMRLRVSSAISSRRCSANLYIAAAKRRRRTCCISSSRIIRSRTATSVSVRSCSCSISSRKT